MQGINISVISGNLTRDPAIRTTAQGTGIISFSVAVNDRIKGKDGNYTDYTNYIDVTAFNAVDYLAKNLSRGSHVVVEGRLRHTTWESKDGSGKRSKLEIIATHIEVERKAQPEAASPEVDYSEEIPF